MGKWSDLAARAKGESRTCAISDISANSSPEPAPAGPNGTNGTNGTLRLPGSLLAGLDRLRTMAAPRIARPNVWPEIVADALRLASDGWAAQALALGWEPLHLFGCSPAAGGLADLEGLAVWLAGRPIVLLDSRSCIATKGPRSHAVFTRREMGGACLLWDLGRRG